MSQMKERSAAQHWVRDISGSGTDQSPGRQSSDRMSTGNVADFPDRPVVKSL